jgi:hypothetical protein
MCACHNRFGTICLSTAYRSWLVAPCRLGRGSEDYVAWESRDVPEKWATIELTRNSSGGYIESQREALAIGLNGAALDGSRHAGSEERLLQAEGLQTAP